LNCTTATRKGEVVVVCGPSGSGKSTLIKCVNALEPYSSKCWNTMPTRERSFGRLVFLLATWVPSTVIWPGKDEAVAKGLALLERVGLKAHAHKFPGQLSGGQQPRVRLSVIVRCGNSSKCWNTMPTRERSFGRLVFLLVVCGPSGSGKSTLIKCVNALEPFQKGQITVDGTQAPGSRRTTC
jgi:ABC-type polar amino acid transport system ATPase subunit